MSRVTLAGNPIDVIGHFPSVGDRVSDFTLTNNSLDEVKLADFVGKRKVLNIFPSVDTGICANSVRTFNQKAADLNNAVVLCISADLPFAQARFCGVEGIEKVQTLSTFRHKAIHNKLGVEITSGPLVGLAARAVIVLDENNNVLYSELVKEIKQEPNYVAALKALS